MASAERAFPNNESADLALFRLVQRQEGVVSRSQLIDAGLSSQQIHRRLTNGTLQKVLPRVYRHASARESWLQQLWAAYLWSAERAVVSHEAAYPDIGLVIEVDGYSVHSSRQSWQHDRHRQNDLVIGGKKVLRYSWWDVCHRQVDIVEALRTFLAPSLPFSDA